MVSKNRIMHKLYTDRVLIPFEQVIASKTKIYIVLELVDGGEFFDIIVSPKI